jgi:hypothetical protein
MIAFAGALRLQESELDKRPPRFEVRPRWELSALQPVSATA